MNTFNHQLFIYPLIVLFLFLNFEDEKQWKGQGAIKKVSTETVPVQLQYKGTFDLGNEIFCSNDFDGARLNGAALTNDTLVTVLITPENTPINASPWYAFKIWSAAEQQVTIRLTYPQGVAHRYFPRLSYDGTHWTKIDSLNYKTSFGQGKKPVSASMRVNIGPDTLWIAAQELFASNQVDKWMNKIESNSFVKKTSIGESRLGKSIQALKIGNHEGGPMIVVLSRQHPPEISGFLAMQAFVETLCSDAPLAARFRDNFNAYVVPLVNPDGADAGQWRHNNGGVDLNRDWYEFNQPETRAIRDYIKQVVDTTNSKLVFFIDFHSTWDDIYYVNYDKEAGNLPGMAHKLIELTGKELPGYTPNVKNLSDGSKAVITSDSYFFSVYGAQAMTYEVGDNTPRHFIRKKAELSAVKMMELLNAAN